MKPLPSPALLPLLLLLPLVPAARRPAPGAPGKAPRPAQAACGSYPDYQPVNPVPGFSWILAYVSMRSCHRVLQDKHGEFSPPAYHSDLPINFWCNWTIWAGSRKHIIIYIQGFMTKEDCNKNEDKILFEGISSLVEDSVVYACWKKEMHVFATFAEAVHVVLLKTYLPNCRDTQFKGKYYIFHNEEGELSSREDLIPETPASKPLKQDHILQSGVVEDLRDVLSFATTTSLGSLDKPTAVDTLIPASHQGLRTEPLETNAPCELDSPWLVAPAPCGQDQGRGNSWGASPTAALDTWGLSLSTSRDIAVDFGYMHGFSSKISETPLLGTLQGEEPFLRTAGVGLESRQAFLHPTLQPKDLGDPQFNIKPTRTSDLDLAAPSQDLSPGRGESRVEGVDPATYLGLGTVGLEKTKRCPLLSNVADGAVSSLAESLMPSLTSRNEVVNGDHSLLLPGRSFSEALSMTEPELRTSVFQHTTFLSFPAPGSFRGVDEVEKVLHPTASWDVLKGQPQLSTQSSCVLQLAPTDPRSIGPHGGHMPRVSSSGVKSCCCLSSTTTQLPLVMPLLPAAQGHAPSGSEMVFSTLGMEMTLMPVRPNPDPVPAELGATDFSPAVSLPAEQPVELWMSEPFAVFTTNAEAFVVPPAQELGGLAKETEPPVPSAFALSSLDGAWTSIAPSARQGGDLVGPLGAPGCLSPGVRKFVLDGDGEQGSWRGEVSAPAGWVDGGSFPTASAARQQVLNPQLGMGLPQLEDLVAPSLPSAPVSLPSDPVPQGIWIPEGGQHHKHPELGPPWTMEYFPVRSCHVVLQGEFGLFYPPLHSDIKTNIWCNWTIWAGPQKHILIYIQGFQASEGCDKNQDKMIFQGVLSNVETKVVYACHNRGTLIFATQATAVYVLLLSGSSSLSSEYKHFKGRYYIFRDHATVDSSNDTIAPVWEISKMDISSKVRHSHDLEEGANGGELGPLEDEMELERNLRDGGTKGRGDSEEVLVEPAAARGDTGRNTKLPVLDIVEGGVQPEPALVPTPACSTTDIPLEAPSSSVGLLAAKILPNLAQTHSSLSAVATPATRHFRAQMVMEEPSLNTSVIPSPLYSSPGVTAEDTTMPGERQEDLFDLASVLASLENDTALQSQHHPGDVLFEVTIEIKHMDWVPHGGRELRKDLLESMKSHIQKNLKLSTNKVNEIKLKEIKRVGRDNLLLTFWLHLRPEERNLSLVLRSQLQELLSTSAGVERPRLVSLFVEDVNECNLGLCGEAADCFNGEGTYLCRCKKDYEDRSPTKSGTLCVPVPRSGISSFFRHPEVLVGAAVSLGLVLLVGILCGVVRRRRPGRDPCPEELGARPGEEPPAAAVMELSHLGDCLRLEPFQLKVRARPPDWISRARAGQAYGVFIEQEESL